MTITRPNKKAHELKMFQRDIFYPVLESVIDLRKTLLALDREELELAERTLADRSMASAETMVQRQLQLQAQRDEIQAELKRKDTLLRAGCHWMATELADTDGIAEKLKFAPTPSPELVRRVMVDKAPLYFEGIEVS